jgi:hypothetical protein
MSQMVFYTGIGSRSTPDNVLKLFTSLGKTFAHMGLVLRSGGALGADEAFERGCDLVPGKKEIYLPWKGFNGNDSFLYTPSQKAMEIAEQYHPAWDNCSSAAKKLHARNSHQVLGANLLCPSNFVVCWTPPTGGTNQALRVAEAHNIECLNLFNFGNDLSETAILNKLGFRRLKLWQKKK